MVENSPEPKNEVSLYIERIRWVLGKMNKNRPTPSQIVIKFDNKNKDKIFDVSKIKNKGYTSKQQKLMLHFISKLLEARKQWSNMLKVLRESYF